MATNESIHLTDEDNVKAIQAGARSLQEQNHAIYVSLLGVLGKMHQDAPYEEIEIAIKNIVSQHFTGKETS